MANENKRISDLDLVSSAQDTDVLLIVRSGKNYKLSRGNAKTTDYNELIKNIPKLNTANSTSQNIGTEEIKNTINLHKISKTGNYSDLINLPDIPKEISDLSDGKSTIENLQNKINEEATTRASETANLGKKIDDEAIIRSNQSDNLQQQITDESTARTNDVASLQKEIEDEAVTRQEQIIDAMTTEANNRQEQIDFLSTLIQATNEVLAGVETIYLSGEKLIKTINETTKIAKSLFSEEATFIEGKTLIYDMQGTVGIYIGDVDENTVNVKTITMLDGSSGGGGHSIIDENGNILPQVTNLQFNGAEVTNIANTTMVSVLSSKEVTVPLGTDIITTESLIEKHNKDINAHENFVPARANYATNAETSEKWKTQRTLTLTGEVSGSGIIDGSKDINIPTIVAKTKTVSTATNRATFSGTFRKQGYVVYAHIYITIPDGYNGTATVSDFIPNGYSPIEDVRITQLVDEELQLQFAYLDVLTTGNVVFRTTYTNSSGSWGINFPITYIID